jgi:hypothetical protein
MTYHRIWNKSNTTGTTSGAGASDFEKFDYTKEVIIKIRKSEKGRHYNDQND